MADIVKLNKAEADKKVSELKKDAERAKDYIEKNVDKTVKSMGEWWIGNAYNAFLNDFDKTKKDFIENIVGEIIAYSNDLNKAVESQLQTDVSNEKNVVI